MTTTKPNDVECRLAALHAELRDCRRCPQMQSRPVHGPPIASRVLLVGQAPGPHEEKIGRPFAWTAGRTLFQWLSSVTGANEEQLRQSLYFSAVARCFPGKMSGGGDRKPDNTEIAACRTFLRGETQALTPELIIPIGSLAIEQVLDRRVKLLVDVIGQKLRTTFHGVACDVIALPHPSGVSTWHKREPGKSLLTEALRLIGEHPALRQAVAPGLSD